MKYSITNSLYIAVGLILTICTFPMFFSSSICKQHRQVCKCLGVAVKERKYYLCVSADGSPRHPLWRTELHTDHTPVLLVHLQHRPAEDFHKIYKCLNIDVKQFYATPLKMCCHSIKSKTLTLTLVNSQSKGCQIYFGNCVEPEPIYQLLLILLGEIVPLQTLALQCILWC